MPWGDKHAVCVRVDWDGLRLQQLQNTRGINWTHSEYTKCKMGWLRVTRDEKWSNKWRLTEWHAPIQKQSSCTMGNDTDCVRVRRWNFADYVLSADCSLVAYSRICLFPSCSSSYIHILNFAIQGEYFDSAKHKQKSEKNLWLMLLIKYTNLYTDTCKNWPYKYNSLWLIIPLLCVLTSN